VRRFFLALALLLVVAACTSDVDTEIDLNQGLVEAAYDICPILWQWQLGVGAVMNDMSYQSFREPDPELRLDLYTTAIDETRETVAVLRQKLAALPDSRYQRFFASEIEKGLEDAEVTIDDTEAEVLAAYAGNDPAYNEIVPIIFLAFEKVIDLPKPELATYGDPELIPAFQSVPQCQHGVKDADDGVPRYVPLEPAPRPQ
jgi:hypothetical protein